MRELERNTHRRATEESAHPPIIVIGRGRLGQAVTGAAEAAGIRVSSAGREGIGEAAAGAEVALLCVPDAAIGEACATLAGAAPDLRFVGHPSGATGLDALASAAAAGAELFSLHPLQTIPHAESTLAGAPAAIAGSSPAALAAAERLASALGLEPFEVPESTRAAYHAAASIASNFLVTLEQSAVKLLEAAGVEDGRELLTPLVLRSAANWAEHGAGALTGPIARGDEATVERHREALGELAPELVPLYEALAERTRQLAADAERRA